MLTWRAALGHGAKMAPSPFARRIAALRAERGWSQNQLADRAGIRQADLSRILSGDRGVKAHHVVRLATALATAPDALLRRTGVDVAIGGEVARSLITRSEALQAEIEHDIERLRSAAAVVQAEIARALASADEGATNRVARQLERAGASLARVTTSKSRPRRAR